MQENRHVIESRRYESGKGLQDAGVSCKGLLQDAFHGTKRVRKVSRWQSEVDYFHYLGRRVDVRNGVPVGVTSNSQVKPRA